MKQKEKWISWMNEINDILGKLGVNLTNLELRHIFCEKPYKFIKERELRLSAKEKINEIEGLKEKVELLDHLLDETKDSKLLTDLEYEKIETLQ